MAERNTTTLHLALDQSDAMSQALIFDNRGQLRAKAEAEVQTFRTQDQRVEHDAIEIAQTLASVTQEACKQVGKQASIRNAGLAAQRSSIVCWDRITGEPLSNVLSWRDRRARDHISSFGKYRNLIHRETGLMLSPHYGMGKLNWCLNHVPAVSESLARGRLAFGPLASFLTHRLVKEKPLLVDPANASRTLLLDLKKLTWSDPLLDLFKIPAKALPRCVPTRHEFGVLDFTHQPIPLRVVSGDQSAALFALGNPEPDVVYINLGSGGFVQQSCGTRPMILENLLTSVVYQSENQGHYAIEGTVNGCGSALRIVAEELGLNDEHLEDNLNEWLTTEDNPPLFLNGVTGLGSPYWQPSFKSEMVGKASKQAQLTAVAESIIFLIQRNLQELGRHLAEPKKLVVTGPMAYSGLCQKLANLSGIRVERPKMQDATARGLAFLCSGSEKWLPLGPATGFPVEQDDALRQRFGLWRQLVRAKLE